MKPVLASGTIVGIAAALFGAAAARELQGAARGAPAPNADLAAHWPLRGDALDYSGNGHHARNHGVVWAGAESGAVFDGRGAYLEVPAAAGLALGTAAFTIALWIHPDLSTDDVTGDLMSQFDPAGRRGFQLGFLDHSGACTSTANTRNVFFGIDSGSEPRWADCGRPGNNLLAYALAVFIGHLYAGTFEAGAGERGGVYRYAGGQRWDDCGSPDSCNAVTALAVHHGELYAAVSRYNAAGSHLPAAANLEIGGKVYRYGGGRRWIDCGRVSDGEFIFGLAVFDGHLFATSMDAPPNPARRPHQGMFRYNGGTNWIFCGYPGGRIAALGVANGRLFGSGYNGGSLGGVFRWEGATNWSNWGSPPGVDQTYSFALHRGELHCGTWKYGKVYRYNGPDRFEDAGRLGGELEVMGLMVYNGMLYGGTLPLAEVYRYEGGSEWLRVGALDHSDVEYRRAWSMAIYQGRLFCGVLPSGRVHALQTGAALSTTREWPSGWSHLAAVREADRLTLYCNGRWVGRAAAPGACDLDLSSGAPLEIGFGAQDYYRGSMRDVRLYRRALSTAEVRRLARVR